MFQLASDQPPQAVGCGFHPDPDCLCDVRFDTPVPIRYGIGAGEDVAGVDEGFVHCSDILFTLKDADYGAPWTSEKFERFMDALMAGWDAVQAERRHPAKSPSRFTVLREQVVDLLRAGHSMVDVPTMLGVDSEDVMFAFVNGTTRPRYADWDDLEWLRFEAAIAADPVNVADVAHACGLPTPRGGSWKSLKRLIELYGKRVNVRQEKSHPRRLHPAPAA